MLATTYPLLDAFWSILEIFIFVIWIWLAIMVFVDIFRSHDMGGWAKAAWVLFVVILPLLGIFVYLIVRGDGMHEREAAQAARQQKAFDSYVRQTAATSTGADEIAKLADLKDRGVITDEEFATMKAKVVN
jgi:Short C-terminal domain/Phospholipase_D-nuclease N-terminal